MAANFIGQNVPSEHLMYVLEIDPPVDSDTDDVITMMPACKVNSIQSRTEPNPKKISSVNFCYSDFLAILGELEF